MISSNEIRFKKLALPCMTARTPLDMIATDCRKGTIQLTLEQARQPTALSDLMQAADPTTMLHDEIDDNGTISATPSPLYGGGSAV